MYHLKQYWFIFLCALFFLPTVYAEALAPGYGSLGYKLPEIGGYDLPVLGPAVDGRVLDTAGNSQSLYNVLKGRYSLLAFIYTHCHDVNGCPLTTHVYSMLKSSMRTDIVLAENLQLISLSFDPERDTPAVMEKYKGNFKYSGDYGNWKFLTTESLAHLEPMLRGYRQDIQRNISIDPAMGSGDISHMLRVFLIDPKPAIRNIYSVEFLHQDLIINDLKTLLYQQSNSKSENQFLSDVRISEPGDFRTHYNQKEFTSNSRSLADRKGLKMNLLSNVKNPPLGLPKLPKTMIERLTDEKIALGRQLFFDRRLSLNDTFSCAMCHIPEQGFTSQELSMAVGIEGRSVRRNTPTIYNTAYATRLFHDGREFTLAQQIWAPLLAKNEMGNPSVGYVINKINTLPGYVEKFRRAFNGQGVNMQTLGEAFAAYQMTLLAGDSDFDRWYYGGDEQAVSPEVKRGYRLFTTKAGCVSCHSIAENYALFTDNELHNTGLGYQQSMGIRSEFTRVNLAPGIFADVEADIIDSVSEPVPSDLGLYEITESPDDRWKFKTPTLRNIGLTAPYMHDGSLGTLEDVIDFYNKGGVKNPVLDPRIRPLRLTLDERAELVAFLRSLTGNNVDLLVMDAFAAEIGN